MNTNSENSWETFEKEQTQQGYRIAHSNNKLFRMVGQPQIDQERGCLTIFRMVKPGMPVKLQTLAAANAQPGDYFGYSSYILDSGKYIAIGAPHANQGKGAVYVFELLSKTLTFVEQAKLTPRADVVNFGWVVKLTEDGKLTVSSIRVDSVYDSVDHTYNLVSGRWIEEL